MKTPADELFRIVDKFSATPMLVVGDLIVDHYIWGKVNRISPEAPVVVVEVTEEGKRPGGAGNVVNNLAALGSRVSVCGVVGDDDNGREIVSMFKAVGADVDGILVDRSRPTTVKTRVIAHAQQVVRVDREVTTPLAQTYTEGIGAAVQAKLSSVKGVIVSDYAKGAISSALFDRIKQGHEQGIVGLGKIPILVDPKAPNYGLYSYASVIKPNRREAEEGSSVVITDRLHAIEAGRRLLKKWRCDMVLITLGEMGMVLVSAGDQSEPTVEIDTVAREVFDVSGAGDTVSAVFGLALAVNATPRQAAELANYAAGVVVGEVGTVAINAEELKEAIRRGGK